MAGYSIGEAYVLDNSGSINTVARGIERQRAEAALRAKKLEEENVGLIDQMDKLNGKGLSTQDLPEFNKKLQDVKNSYYKYRSAKTDQERMVAKMEVDNKFKDTFQYADNAVVSRRELARQAQHFISNRDKYDDDVIKDVSVELAKPVSQINLSKVDPLLRERKVDVSKISGLFDKIDNGLLSTAKYGAQKRVSDRIGNNTGTSVMDIKEVSPQSQLQRYKIEYDTSPELRHFLSTSYPTLTPDQQVSAFAQARRDMGTLRKEERGKFIKNSKPPKASGSGGAGSEQALLRDWVDGVVNNDKSKIDDLRSSFPEGTTLGYSADGKTFNVKIPDGITDDGRERYPVERKFDTRDPQMGNKVAYFLSTSEVAKNAAKLQKVYKDKGKPASAYNPVGKTSQAKAAEGKKASNELLDLLKKGIKK